MWRILQGREMGQLVAEETAKRGELQDAQAEEGLKQHEACIIWHCLKLEPNMFQGLFYLLSSFYGMFKLDVFSNLKP
jgi:hypothetical protein